ncbi:hypothetical protein D3C84_593480 [compost metagenome]
MRRPFGGYYYVRLHMHFLVFQCMGWVVEKSTIPLQSLHFFSVQYLWSDALNALWCVVQEQNWNDMS